MARSTLTEMPIRKEQELDPVTLHNQALFNHDREHISSFEKFDFLLDSTQFPPVTFANAVLLNLKYEYIDSAADLLATHPAQSAELSPVCSYFKAVHLRLC